MNTTKRITLLTVILISNLLISQNEPTFTFGEISTDEMNQTHCSFDSLAEAVVLCDIGESKFVRARDGFNIKFKRHKRVKIFKEAGRDEGTVKIPYYIDSDGRSEKVEFIRAITYNSENGSINQLELEEENIFDEKINENWRQKKFICPNVQEGSIVEFVYIVQTPFIFNLNDWEFQTSIPTEYSQYKVFMIPFYDYVHLGQGIEEWDVQNSEEGSDVFNDYGVEYNYYIHTFGLNNIESFKDESFITSRNDYIKKLDFQLATINNLDGSSDDIMTTWKDQRERLMDHFDFGRYMTRSQNPAKKILKEELSLEGLEEEFKIEKIINYVKTSFIWNRNQSKYASQSPKELQTSKSGNSADLNLFLITLLNEAGIKANPMILSTRENGRLNMSYPLASSTNYVVAFLENNNLIIDGTQPELNHYLIPPYCINELGLVVNNKEDDQWLRIQYKTPSSETNSIKTTINPDEQTMVSDISCKNKFYKAFNQRRYLGSEKDEIKSALEEDFLEVDSVDVIGFENPLEPFTCSFRAVSEMEQLGEYLMVKPLLGLPLSSNPLVMDKRSYPVDFIYPYRNTYKVELIVPDGYKISKLPENTLVKNENVFVQVSYMPNESNNTIQVYAVYEIKKSVYQPEDYSELKSGLDLIAEVMNEDLLIEAVN